MTLPDRICDPHHHLWDRPGSQFLVEQLGDDLATVPQVTRTVFVECSAWYRESGPDHLREVGETEWVTAHSKQLNSGDTIQGIVAATDLRLGARAEQALHAHIEAAAGRFRGIRQRATWDPSPLVRPSQPDPGEGLLGDPDFRDGFALLHALGGVFDAWVYFPQLPEVVDLARAFPKATIVLDHLGGPITLGPYKDRAAVLERWRPLMADVATCENVVLKVGGIGMPLYGTPWHKHETPPSVDEVVEFWRDPVDFCIDAFGPDRCMLESNFPVDKLSMPYATLWDAFDLMTTDYSPAERAAMFHDTAVRAYRLDQGSPR